MTADNRITAQRRERLAQLRGGGWAWPNDFRRDAMAGDLQERFAGQERDALARQTQSFAVCGRLMAMRGPFAVIEDESGRIQLYLDKAMQEQLRRQCGGWDLGDIVAGHGPPRRSQRGELYLALAGARLLAKNMRPLPEKYHGLQDAELRHRQRYVDLIANADSRRRFRARAQMVAAMRAHLHERGFMEVETPMLHPIPGGAQARPFVTRHQALEQDMYLRVAPELYLKRLVVGGFERVFELGRCFRNEGLSSRHNPEFSMLELYWAYNDNNAMMELVEQLLRAVAQAVLGGDVLAREGGDDINLGAPFARIGMTEALRRQHPDADLDSLDGLRELARSAGVAQSAEQDAWGPGKWQLEIFEKSVEPGLVQPTFITDYPAEVSPLARRRDDDAQTCERFELFIGGWEIANGFSELNDPEDQAERFRAQVAAREGGDEEAMHYDDDYIRALEYAMPPTAGAGIGVDRLAMLLTGAQSIRDVLLFPAMRPED